MNRGQDGLVGFARARENNTFNNVFVIDHAAIGLAIRHRDFTQSWLSPDRDLADVLDSNGCAALLCDDDVFNVSGRVGCANASHIIGFVPVLNEAAARVLIVARKRLHDVRR